MNPKIIPELDVSSLEKSLVFYRDVIGFKVIFERSKEKFCFLDLGGAQIMLEEASGPGRRFRTAPLEYPYGRGVNFQIQVNDVDELYARTCAAGYQPYLPIEEKWYRRGDIEQGHRQFVVSDPDGFLLRFYTDLGQRRV